MSGKVEITQQQIAEFLSGQQAQANVARAEQHGGVAAIVTLIVVVVLGYVFLF